jgi:signal transduction histidine kinase
VTALGKLLRTTAFKLALGLLAVFALTACLSLGYVLWQSGRIIQSQIAETVEAEIASLEQRYSGTGLLGLLREVEERSLQSNAFLYLVTAPTGQPLTGNIAALPPGILDQSRARETEYVRRDAKDAQTHHSAYVRVLVLPNGFRLLVGRDLAERSRFAAVLARAILGGLVLVILLGLVGGLVVARRVLVRLDALTATSRTIMAGDLSRRLPVSGSGDEFDRLAVATNTMLDKIGTLMLGLRQVTDDVAHDLKTPLTRLRNQAEEALRHARTGQEFRDALEQVIAESDGLIGTFNSMLLIARAESSAAQDMMKPLDATELVESVGELYEPVAEDAGRVLNVRAVPGVRVEGSRELLSQALANLIDNALKYAGQGEGVETPGDIELVMSADERRVRFEVADRGPGIPAADRDRAVERFVRLETSRSLPGSGLGLSLVSAIAHLHKGTFELHDNAPGLRAVIDIPRIA